MLLKKDIAIVILNWNGKTLLKKFLPSVVQYSNEANIYLADNASTDESVAHIKENFPSVKIIKNATNGGYAKGYNNALKHVKESIYCLLNNDVEVTPNWLNPILSTFNSSKNTAIIQPKILDFKNKNYFEYAGAAGGFIDSLGYPYCRGRVFDTVEKDNDQYNDTVDIFWASGACFFIKKEVFTILNGFDESFFAHMEEIDLCWRVHNTNHKVVYVGASEVFHFGGATLSNLNPKKTYLNFRNSLFTLIKNASGIIMIKVFLRLTLDGIAAARFLMLFKPKHMVAILKAHLSFYKNLNRLLKLRQQTPKKSNYYTSKSIVWSYYIKRIRYFRI